MGLTFFEALDQVLMGLVIQFKRIIIFVSGKDFLIG